LRCFHRPRTSIFTHVPGFGKDFVALGRLRTWSGFGRPKLVKRLRENRCFYDFREFGDGVFHILLWRFGMGLDKPQPFINAARNFRRIRRVGW
jgi:hypothetical protein